MESPREPLPPIVDQSLIEAPFEVAVLGSSLLDFSTVTRGDQGTREAQESAPSARELRKAARREAKQAKKQSALQQPASPVVETTSDDVSPASHRGLSFDDLIGGTSS